MTLTPPPTGNGATVASSNGHARVPTNGAPGRRRPTKGTVFIALGVLVGLNLIVFAFWSASSNDTRPDTPVAIEFLIPVRNAVIRPQEAVGADLADNYTGVLIIDGHEIPEDQLTRVVELGQVMFQPGPGKEFTEFSPGRHRIEVIYWKQIDQRLPTSPGYTWQFTAG